jgi:hypothetical protein
VFSSATNLAQPSSPSSESTLSTATVEDDDFDYGNYVEPDFEDYLMPFGKPLFLNGPCCPRLGEAGDIGCIMYSTWQN